MCTFKIECPMLDFDCVGSSNSDLPFIEVTAAEPYRIQDVSQQWLDNFLFSREEIAGRSLRVICGPATRLFDVKQAIATAAHGKEANAPVCFYSSAGNCRMMAVKAQPSLSEGMCKLTMVPSDAVTLKEALQLEDCSRAIISAQKPYMIEQVNNAFSYEFGMTQELWMNKSLRMIHGPRTNSAAFGQMLKGATDGLSRTEEVIMYTSNCQELWCEVSVVPVLSSDGSIGHLMVAFSPRNDTKEDLMSKIEAKLDGLRLPAHPMDSNNSFSATSSADSAFACFEPTNFNTNNNKTMCFEPQHDASFCPASSSSSSDSFHFPTQATPMHQTIFCTEEPSARTLPPVDQTLTTSLKLIPRKKRPVSGEFVELTTAKLQELSGKSMKAAAEELGIAASTLKKACRKLGVERWPSGTQGRNKGLDYDGSYVRRLLNKYKNTTTSSATSPTVASPASTIAEEESLTSTEATAETAPVQQSWVQWAPEDASMSAHFGEFDVMDDGLGAMQW